jgi:hypothetical protein
MRDQPVELDVAPARDALPERAIGDPSPCCLELANLARSVFPPGAFRNGPREPTVLVLDQSLQIALLFNV